MKENIPAPELLAIPENSFKKIAPNNVLGLPADK